MTVATETPCMHARSKALRASRACYLRNPPANAGQCVCVCDVEQAAIAVQLVQSLARACISPPPPRDAGACSLSPGRATTFCLGIANDAAAVRADLDDAAVINAARLVLRVRGMQLPIAPLFMLPLSTSRRTARLPLMCTHGVVWCDARLSGRSGSAGPACGEHKERCHACTPQCCRYDIPDACCRGVVQSSGPTAWTLIALSLTPGTCCTTQLA